jgi:hypothetical protein
MIKDDWGFKEVIENIETLRSEYNRFLTSFSIFERKKSLKLCRQFKTKLYRLKFDEYKKNLIWKYINDEIEYEEIFEGDIDGFSNKRNNEKI